MSKKIVSCLILIIIILGFSLVLYGCEKQKEQSEQPPILPGDDQTTPEGVVSVVNASNQFAFEFYSELNKNEHGNLFFSPYSISTALAMTYEGARGKTAEEMKAVFHFPEKDVMRSNIAKIYNDLNKGNANYNLNTANALWAQKDYPFLQDYFSIIGEYYGGNVTNLDFKKETEQSRQIINSWVEDKTNDKIKDLIPEGMLDPMTRLVLTNAIYFKGTWVYEFNKKYTSQMDFKITPTNIVKVPMMYMKPDKSKFNYSDTEELQILELPYKGEEISMLIILPKEDLTIIEESLTSAKLEEWKSKMKETQIDFIYLPKFTFTTKYSLNNQLSRMGMPTAFTRAADFSGMDGATDLFIAFVIHQAFIDVNEEGTEAAAATAVGISETSANIPQNIFKADHPFIFLIQEKKTGNILFLGRVVNPNG